MSVKIWIRNLHPGGPHAYLVQLAQPCGELCCGKGEVTHDIKMRLYSTDAQGFSLKKFKKLGVSIKCRGWGLIFQ